MFTVMQNYEFVLFLAKKQRHFCTVQGTLLQIVKNIFFYTQTKIYNIMIKYITMRRFYWAFLLIFSLSTVVHTASAQQDSINFLYVRPFIDLNGNCILDSAEQHEPNILVQVEGIMGGQKWFGISNATPWTPNFAFFEWQPDTLLVKISTLQGAPINNCDPVKVPVELNGIIDSVFVDVPFSPVSYNCPTYMFVDIGSPLLRWCGANYYDVWYANLGQDTATNVSIDVVIDEHFTVSATSIPVSSSSGDTITFDIGTVPSGGWGSIEITVDLDCDSTVVGQTHCMEAHIYPDTICDPGDPSWSGASLVVNGQCEGDSVAFTIKNTGANMQNSVQYIVVEDHVIMSTSPPIQLNANQEQSFKVAANGATWRVEIPQVPGHPSMSFPSASVEACGVDSAGNFSMGFVTQFAQDDVHPSISIHCQESRAAYDPNEKLAYSKGYGAEHYIEANTSLEYVIHFQNTGNLSANHVRLVDQLPEYLNVYSVQPGVASHHYIFTYTDDGELTFDFPNIMLPDSNSNEPESHGFVKFRINQKPDNPVGTVIENDAAIYFDYNAPIITNTAWHTIGEDFVPKIIVNTIHIDREGSTIDVFPNPASEFVQFTVHGSDRNAIQLQLFDMSGRIVMQREYDTNTFTVYADKIPEGMYFFRISDQQGLIGNGKVVRE